MKTIKWICSSLIAISTMMANAGEVISGVWPIVVVGPVAAKTLPQENYKEIGTMNDKKIFIDIFGKANDPVTGSDGSDPDKVSGVLSMSSIANSNKLSDRIIGTIKLSTIPDADPFGTSKISGILLADYVGKANDPVTGSDGSDPEPKGGVGKISGEFYSVENNFQKLGDISIDMNTIQPFKK